MCVCACQSSTHLCAGDNREYKLILGVFLNYFSTLVFKDRSLTDLEAHLLYFSQAGWSVTPGDLHVSQPSTKVTETYFLTWFLHSCHGSELRCSYLNFTHYASFTDKSFHLLKKNFASLFHSVKKIFPVPGIRLRPLMMNARLRIQLYLSHRQSIFNKNVKTI